MTEHRYEGPERRNGRDWTEGFPLWFRALFLLGPTAAIAVYLVWVGANQVPLMVMQSKQNYDAILRNRELLQEHIRTEEETRRLLQWICAGVSKTDADRKNCFEK